MKARLFKNPSTYILTILLCLSANFTLHAGEQLTETRELDSFNKITATNGVNILLRQGGSERVEVRISNGLLSDVSTTVSKGELKVKMRAQINKDISVIAIVYYKSLKEININKGASFETRGVILTDIFKIKASTGAEVKAELECKNLEVSAGGGSSVALYGWTQRLEASANTKANIQTKKLKSDRALIRSVTGAKVWVHPTDYLEAVANTGGIIYYTKKPKEMNKRLSSGGELINKVERIGDSLIMDEESN